jgi:MoaA/NifB/PqqE/SkfB family radical SAM enzyme
MTAMTPVPARQIRPAEVTERVRRWTVDNEAAFLAACRRGLAAECPSWPVNVFVEPINACNMACPFCATNFETRARTVMPLAVFERFIRDLSDRGIFPRLTLTGEGEPFLHKQAVEMVRIAKEAGFNVWIITNGSMLGRERIERLIAARIDRVQFSIDSVKPEVYDRMRVAKGSRESYFARTMGNILHFARRNWEEGAPVYLSISAVQTALNRDDAEEFKRFWYALPVNNVFLAPLSTLQANAPLAEAKALHYEGPMKEKPVCAVPFTNAKINADGSVNICTHDYNGVWPVGNVAEASFAELWNGERARKLRQALLDAEVDDFVAIGHDCRRCNNPLIGYGTEDWVKGSAVRLERTLAPYAAANPVDDGPAKYARLLDLAAGFPVPD